MKKINIEMIQHILFRVLLAYLLLYLIIGEIVCPNETPHEIPKCEKLKIDWYWEHDGTREKIKVPGDYPVPKGEPMIITATLPEDVQTNQYIRFYSLRQDVVVYIDGEKRTEYSTKDTRLYGTTSSAYFVFIPLYGKDAGKEITLSVMNSVSYSGVIRTIYIGEKLALWGMVIKENGLELLVAVLTLVFGLVIVLICHMAKHFLGRALPLRYLGWGVFLAACWIILNSDFRQLLFPNISVASDVTFMIIMLVPFPILMYMDELQNHRYQKVHITLELLSVLDCFLCAILHTSFIIDYSQSISAVLIVSGSALGFVGVSIFIDWLIGELKNYWLAAVGIVGAIFATFLQFALYYMKRSIPFTGAFMAFGLVFWLFVAAISTFFDLLKLEQEKQKAISDSESKGNFLANMSHEIRTPINAILGMDEMILRESNQQTILEYATDIRSAGKSLLSLINDILDFSKIESGKMEIIPVTYRLSDLLLDCYQMMFPKAEEKGLGLFIKNEPDIPNVFYGDEVRIRQILVNFLSNAIKYSSSGDIEIIVRGQPVDSNVWAIRLMVQDCGMGIRNEDLPYLFDSFQRVEEKKNRHVEGTGLGLSVCKQLTELMGGTIDVETTYGKGSLFWVTLPQEVRSDEVMGSIQVKEVRDRLIENETTLMHDVKGHVLVVDDVDLNRKVFVSLLKGTGLTVDSAASGKECLKMIRDTKYDIIFLDHMMPEMDGIETFQAMQEDPTHSNQMTPVIMLTANAIAGVKEEYISLGFTDYLSKPVQGHVLEEMIQRYLRKS